MSTPTQSPRISVYNEDGDDMWWAHNLSPTFDGYYHQAELSLEIKVILYQNSFINLFKLK